MNLLVNERNVVVDDLAELPNKIKGFYVEMKDKKIILINRNVELRREKRCVLAEELGHLKTSCGDVTDQSKAESRKQERKARGWAYQKLIPLREFVSSYKNGVRSRYELAEYLNVTEQFLIDAVKYYKEKYGLYREVENYLIYFEPLGIVENFERKGS